MTEKTTFRDTSSEYEQHWATQVEHDLRLMTSLVQPEPFVKAMQPREVDDLLRITRHSLRTMSEFYETSLMNSWREAPSVRAVFDFISKENFRKHSGSKILIDVTTNLYQINQLPLPQLHDGLLRGLRRQSWTNRNFRPFNDLQDAVFMGHRILTCWEEIMDQGALSEENKHFPYTASLMQQVDRVAQIFARTLIMRPRGCALAYGSSNAAPLMDSFEEKLNKCGALFLSRYAGVY